MPAPSKAPRVDAPEAPAFDGAHSVELTGELTDAQVVAALLEVGGPQLDGLAVRTTTTLGAAEPKEFAPDMIFELTSSLTDIFFDVYNGTLQTAVEEYHDWFSTPHCTSIGLPTPFEAGIGEGLDWFRRLKRDQQ